jgi:protein-disulfide isomerase
MSQSRGGGSQDRRRAASGPVSRSRNTVLIIAMVAGAVMIVLGLLQPFSRPPGSSATSGSIAPSAATGGNAQLVREDSHQLTTAADGKVTLVEFLDFACVHCDAVYPSIEELRQQYQGRVTFVVRYFPLDSHVNSLRAARAVEAAAQQGQFEAMYHRMFTTQSEWGEQKPPADDLFRSYAAELGLDVARWDADYASPTTAARIQIDIDDGLALGLHGVPSFFLNGQPLSPMSMADFTRALDDALTA